MTDQSTHCTSLNPDLELKPVISSILLAYYTIQLFFPAMTEPWDLPAVSWLRSRDMDWYFFSMFNLNRSPINRTTKEGYWKG